MRCQFAGARPAMMGVPRPVAPGAIEPYCNEMVRPPECGRPGRGLNIRLPIWPRSLTMARDRATSDWNTRMNPVALLVGASGVTGTPLAEELLGLGWKVYGVSRRSPVLKPGTP